VAGSGQDANGDGRRRRRVVLAVVAAVAALVAAPVGSPKSSPKIDVRLTTGASDGVFVPLRMSVSPNVVKLGRVTIVIHNLDRTAPHQLFVNNVKSPWVGSGGKGVMHVRFRRTGTYVVEVNLTGSENGGSGSIRVVR